MTAVHLQPTTRSGLKVCVADDLRAWDDYVNHHDLAAAYHQSGWKAVIEQSFGHSTQYLQAMEGERIVGILPLVVMKSLFFGGSVVSLPFVNYGGMLADEDSVKKALLEEARNITTRNSCAYLELRHVMAHGLGLISKQHKVTMILDLQAEADRQWQAFDPKVRNQVRKAEKSGLWIQIGGQELLESFYRIFARNMRDLGTPVYGREFFQAILTNFPSSAKLFISRLQEETVAAGLITTFKDTVEMPWAASLREHRVLCGNMLLYWEAIKYSIKHGFRKFDFGRSNPGAGTYKFKEQWGARPVPLTWEYWTANTGPLPEVSPRNPKYGMAIQIWKKLPVYVANTIGPRIARAIP